MINEKYIDENKKYEFHKKSSARHFCEFFIIKHHEMIGNRSSYDKKKKYINGKHVFYKKDPQENSMRFPY